MKKSILTLLFIFAISFITISFAENMFTSSDSNTGSRQDTFDIKGSSPWLFLAIPEGNTTVTLFQWSSPVRTYYMTPYNDAGSWYSFESFIFTNNSNNYSWNDIESIGNWDIALNYERKNGDIGSLSTQFTMVPEPISSVLFLLGGAGLALRQSRKKKKDSI